MIYDHIVDTIGNTPIVRLHSFNDRKGNYFVKVESFNPGSSSKDRIGITIIDDAEKKGLLKPGGTIVEATSGNTGLGLALVAKKKGYNVILVMPDKMSAQKMNLVKAIGCKVVVCPTEVEPDDPSSYYSVSKRIAEETNNSFYANQYYNEANPIAHYLTTGPEIWEATAGKITHFIAGVGTGGTISGTAKYLKEKNPNIKIIGIDPLGSILAHYHRFRDVNVEAKGYKVEGVGEDIIPSNVHFDLIDEFVTVDDKTSFEWARRLAEKEGILAGGSSGMAVAGTYIYSEGLDDDAYVVTLLPDTGERYLEKVFSESWLRSNGFLPQPNTLVELLDSKAANLPKLIYIEEEDRIKTAIDKILKFGIKYVLIRSQDGLEFNVISKDTLYSLILDGTATDTKITDLELRSIHAVQKGCSITELFAELKKSEPILIKDGDAILGLLTRQDIFNNFQLSELSNRIS